MTCASLVAAAAVSMFLLCQLRLLLRPLQLLQDETV